MEIEQLEIRDYLSQCAPLNKLDSENLEKVVNSLEISYIRRGDVLLKAGESNQFLYLVRTGALEVYDTDGNLFSQLSEGEWAGHRSTILGGIVRREVKAIEDSLLYAIPSEVFIKLLNDNESVREYFSEHKPERLRSAIRDIRDTEKSTLISTRVGELTHGIPLMIQQDTSIFEAAKLMKDATVTAMLIMENNTLRGIVTDRAFCTKVVASGMDLNEPVANIMTSKILTMPSSAAGSEAMLIMARHNIRHIPVIENDKVMGMITATDLIRRQSHNAIYLINEIRRADKVEELVDLSKQLPNTLVNLVQSSLTADDTAHAISSIGRAITRRLLEMAEKKLGDAPINYAFILAGSQARNEQTAHSDQDNALILSDDYEEDKHGKYFEDLAKFVSDGLDACGYIYCPGDVMATNPKWRQPFSVWSNYFKHWINQPEPKALMYASIFFDLRYVYGDQKLLKKLQKKVFKMTQRNGLFLRLMAENALHYRPPLGLFRHFVLEKTGAEKKALNMKKRGVVPIIDLARVYALEAGIKVINTQERLNAACEAGKLSKDGMADLRDAFEFIGTVRLVHQAKQIESGKPADNYVSPEELSSLERRHLKDAFEVVSTLQTVMQSRYQ